MKKAVLDSLLQKKAIISIYSNRDSTDKFAAGYLLSVSESHLLFASIDPCGNYDGYMVRSLDDVFLIEQDSFYLQKITKLYKLKQQTHSIINESCQSKPVVGLLRYAFKNKKIVTIQLVNSGFDDAQGFVEEIDDENVVIQKVSGEGFLDGIAILSIDEITYLSCDSQEEAALLLLTKESI